MFRHNFLFIIFVIFLTKIFGKTDVEKSCSNGIDKTFLTELFSYSNTFLGAFRDHYATTWTFKNHPKALQGYYQIDVFGLIANSSDPLKSEEFHCECLREIVQLYDEQWGLGGTIGKPGLFGRIDHKLVLSGNEKNEPLEKYMRTGEKLYCVPEYGQCGASVPLFQWFSTGEIDTLVTTHDKLIPESDPNLVSKGILCYIWPLDYKSGQEAPTSPELLKMAHPHVYQREPRIDVQESYLSAVRSREPVMMNQEVFCPSLMSTNGHWSYTTPNRNPGTVAFLNCNAGYAVHNVSSAVMCQRTGRWMPEPPTCEPSGCRPMDRSNSNGRIIYNGPPIDDQLYPIGSTSMLVCDEKMDVSHDGADVAYCSLDGWQPKNLGHCEKVCPLFVIENGEVIYTDGRGFDQKTNTNGTIATVICERGTKLTGLGTAVCLDGNWNVKDIGECRVLTCPKLDEPSDGRLIYFNPQNDPLDVHSMKITPGTTVKLTCAFDDHLKIMKLFILLVLFPVSYSKPMEENYPSLNLLKEIHVSSQNYDKFDIEEAERKQKVPITISPTKAGLVPPTDIPQDFDLNLERNQLDKKIDEKLPFTLPSLPPPRTPHYPKIELFGMKNKFFQWFVKQKKLLKEASDADTSPLPYYHPFDPTFATQSVH
uniref:Sushi domain-containing protein n=1 Tax=Panagrolaimus sp. JU765 TaxID=591449 RepID=A0AC34PYL0_9BILA